MANDTDANKNDTPSSNDSSQQPPATTNKVDDMLSSLTNWIPAPDYISQLMDEQRKSRLGQCRKLEQVLQECRESSSHRLPSSEQRQQLEDFPMGIRMVRYFDWRDQLSNNCVREEHAVWACRAVGLQCGPDLVAVRECFRRKGPATVLAQPDTAYELITASESSTKNNAVCKDLQQQLGACVRDKAVALEERMRSRGS